VTRINLNERGARFYLEELSVDSLHCHDDDPRSAGHYQLLRRPKNVLYHHLARPFQFRLKKAGITFVTDLVFCAKISVAPFGFGLLLLLL
jgi:hypothetical protein